MISPRSIFLVLMLAWGSLIQADEIPPFVKLAVSALAPGVEPDSVSASPIPDLYEVVYGPHLVYVTRDGRYMVRGDLVEVATGTNITDQKRKRARIAAIDNLNESSMIVFAPRDKAVKYTVSVFTDVDCPYCVRLHKEVPELNALGIKVRYLAFPRAGIPSRSYDKMVSVWCADDTRRAMTDAKLGGPLERRTCDNPVKRHYAMGQLVGVNGTPTIVLESGEVIPGYVPAARLLQIIESKGAG